MRHDTTRRTFLQAAASLGVAGGLLGARAAGAEEPQPENTPKAKPAFQFAMASYTLREFKLDDALRMTKRLGLGYICLKSFHLPLESTPEQIADAVAKVAASGVKLYAGGVITMDNEAQVNQAFDYAKAAGMATIVGSPQPAVLSLVEKKVQDYDIQVAVHNHGPDERTYPTPETVMDRIKDLDPRIGLCIDIGHTTRAGADPAAAAEKYADRLLDVHIKDVSAATRRGSTVEAGRGVIDLPRFLRTLLKTGYANKVAFEFEKDGNDPLPGVAESVGYVHGVLAVI